MQNAIMKNIGNMNHENLSILKKGIEQSIDGIAIASLDGIVTFVNEAWAKMHEISLENIIGNHLAQFHSEEQLQTEVIPFNEMVIKNGKHLGYVGHIKKDGTPFPSWMSVTTLVDEDQKPIGLLAVCRDITEMKQYEEEIIKQKERAEAANVAKNEFLMKISHELRTPMNGIMGSADLFSFSELNDEQKIYLSMLYNSSQRMMSLISNLLEFTMIDVKDEQKKYVSFSLEELIKEILNHQKPLALKKNLPISYEINSDVQTIIYSDRARLKLILLNLVNNAIKFTKKGSVFIKISRDNKMIRFDVKDTGIGINKQNQQKIFDCFTQEDSSMTRQFEGLGVGLYLSRLFARRLKGDLTVQSIPKKGSIFSLRLPNNTEIH